MLNLFLFIHCKAFTEVDYLLQFVNHLIGKNPSILLLYLLSIILCTAIFGTCLSVHDGFDSEEPIYELLAFLQIGEPLVNLFFLMSSK